MNKLPASSRADNWIEITPTGINQSPKNLGERIAEFRKNINQLSHMIKSQKRKRGFGMVLGELWLLLDPILHSLLYYFITQVIFSYHGEGNRFFMIMIALTFWRLHSRMIGGATHIFSDKAGILRQTNYPLHLIIYEFVAVNLMLFSYSFLTLFSFLMIAGFYPTLAWLWLPVVFVSQLLFTLCLTFVLSIAGTFIKDIGNAMFIIVSIWWYLSPGIYDISRIPEQYRDIFMLNPFAHFLPSYQSILLKSSVPEIAPLLLIGLLSLLTLSVAFIQLKKARYYFFKYI